MNKLHTTQFFLVLVLIMTIVIHLFTNTTYADDTKMLLNDIVNYPATDFIKNTLPPLKEYSEPTVQNVSANNGFLYPFFALIGFLFGLCFDQLFLKHFFSYGFENYYQYTNTTSEELLIHDLLVQNIDIIHAYYDIQSLDRTYTAVAGTFEEFYRRYNYCFLMCDFDRISLSRYWHEAQILYNWQGWYFRFFLDQLQDIHWFLKYIRALSMLRRNQIYNLGFNHDAHDLFLWPQDIYQLNMMHVIHYADFVGIACM